MGKKLEDAGVPKSKIKSIERKMKRAFDAAIDKKPEKFVADLADQFTNAYETALYKAENKPKTDGKSEKLAQIKKNLKRMKELRKKRKMSALEAKTNETQLENIKNLTIRRRGANEREAKKTRERLQKEKTTAWTAGVKARLGKKARELKRGKKPPKKALAPKVSGITAQIAAMQGKTKKVRDAEQAANSKLKSAAARTKFLKHMREKKQKDKKKADEQRKQKEAAQKVADKLKKSKDTWLANAQNAFDRYEKNLDLERWIPATTIDPIMSGIRNAKDTHDAKKAHEMVREVIKKDKEKWAKYDAKTVKSALKTRGARAKFLKQSGKGKAVRNVQSALKNRGARSKFLKKYPDKLEKSKVTWLKKAKNAFELYEQNLDESDLIPDTIIKPIFRDLKNAKTLHESRKAYDRVSAAIKKDRDNKAKYERLYKEGVQRDKDRLAVRIKIKDPRKKQRGKPPKKKRRRIQSLSSSPPKPKKIPKRKIPKKAAPVTTKFLNKDKKKWVTLMKGAKVHHSKINSFKKKWQKDKTARGRQTLVENAKKWMREKGASI